VPAQAGGALRAAALHGPIGRIQTVFEQVFRTAEGRLFPSFRGAAKTASPESIERHVAWINGFRACASRIPE
jgi:hypothetical protein